MIMKLLNYAMYVIMTFKENDLFVIKRANVK
jgi:hypothetical protein